jgi:DNA primase
MLTTATIQAVKDLPITQVLSPYLQLKKQGTNYTACCPFHNEKSPSFVVSPSKEIYKCFGCGASGDAINFVMQHEKSEFIQAIETIANQHNITIEHQQNFDTEKYNQQKQIKADLQNVLNLVIDTYKNNLLTLPENDPVQQYLLTRGISKETQIEWSLGWATADWRHITPQLINHGHFNHAQQMGIIKTSTADETSHFDGYRSRITIPIQNQHGQNIGIAGRLFTTEQTTQPKYINPTQNPLYNKSATLYGLSRAAKAIQQSGYAWLAEGYFDVISMHQYGDINTIGTCGTALTQEQCQLLKKYTNHIILLRDADDAGQKAAERDIQTLLPHGFKIEVGTLPPGSKDPDELIQTLTNNLNAA